MQIFDLIQFIRTTDKEIKFLRTLNEETKEELTKTRYERDALRMKIRRMQKNTDILALKELKELHT